MVLRPRRADGPNRSAHDRRRFSIPRAVAVRSRCPIDRVLQNPGNGVVVFRRHDQDGVRLTYAPLQLHNFSGRVLLLVLIEAGDAVKLERSRWSRLPARVRSRRAGRRDCTIRGEGCRRCRECELVCSFMLSLRRIFRLHPSQSKSALLILYRRSDHS